MAAEGDAVELSVEAEPVRIAGEIAGRVAAEQIDFIALGRESKRDVAIARDIKVGFGERDVAVGRNGASRRDAEFLRITEIIREIPVADIGGGAGEISQLDGVGRRSRVAMG